MKLKDTLLIVGKSKETRSILYRIFSDSYNIIEATTHEQGLFLFEENMNCIAAVLLDIRPPKSRRDSLTSRMRSIPGSENVPIIILSDPGDTQQEIKGYEYGASDVIFKPLNETTIYHRVKILTELAVHRNHLEVLVQEQADIMRSSNESMVDVLSTIIEYRSIETGNHVMRIREYTRVLLEKVMGTYSEYGLTPEDVASIVSASSLHDIGKISIPDSILNKPGRLTDEEFEIMKSHTTSGARILENLNEVGDRKYLRYAYNICLYHHERWDGGGYPEGLVGDEIPICAQVVGIADVYDALTSDRVYKKAYPHTKAINMILNGECGAFSHKVLECLKKVRDEFEKIHLVLNDAPSDTKNTPEDLTTPLPAPSYQLQKVDALQSVQVKYQTLLHYAGATVIETDLISGVYHVVYNPDPDFYFSGQKGSIAEALQDMMNTSVHPEDRVDAAAVISEIKEKITGHGLRKIITSLRVYIPSSRSYVTYKVTYLHIKDNIPGTAAVMIVFEPEAYAPSLPDDIERSFDYDDGGLYFYNLIGSTIVCENNSDFRIVYGFDNLFTLLGYTSDEIEKNFGNSLMEMVLPEDRPYLLKQIDEQLAEGNLLELEYRMMTKNGSSVWVIDKTRVLEDSSGKSYFYSSLSDNTRSKKIQHQLQQELERSRLIINQSNDIIFELDIETDHLWCSDQWEERFGHKALTDNYTEKVYKFSHIHPDDMPKMKEGISRLVSGEAHIEVNVRIVNSDGIYTWNQIRATSKKDESGKVRKAIGVIVDIDREIQSIQQLQKKSEMDSLTGLYNKEATQKRITDLLADRSPDKKSALLILDLDNFKSVNDTYGHLFGDNVLMKTAMEIRKYFRSSDITGRIGGDEFAVYMNGFEGDNIIHTRCQFLVDSLSELYKEMLLDINVSCSIGIAMIPEHGDSFVEVYNKADQALYQAKRNGKNCYFIYDDKVSVAAQNLVTSISDTIDSNEQPGFASNSILYYLFQTLYESTDKYETIRNILAEVGRRMNVSRVYIFESNDKRTELSNTFEWCNDGIEPEIDNLQNLNYIDGEIAGYNEVYNERGILYCTDISTLEPRFRKVLEPQGIKSLLQCAIYDKGEFCGMIGFDECHLNRNWTQEQIDMLTLLARAVALFLLKEREHEKIQLMSDNLTTVLNNQDAWVYVIDPETFQLRYINQRTLDIAGDIKEGDYCYKTMMNRDTPCPDCPSLRLDKEKHADAVINNLYFNLNVRCRAAEITWNGEKACLITCHELK